MKKIDKSMFKIKKENIEMFLYFRRRGFKKPNKKGKGSYNRKKIKNMEEY